MRHDGEVTAGGRRQLLNACPRAIDARVKRRPRLAVRRRVVRREEVEPEDGVGRAAAVAEAPLLEERIEGERNAGDGVKTCGGGAGAHEVARRDLRGGPARAATGQALGRE